MSWIYIVGRGHSGSTLIDGILGNSDQIESVGELISGLSRFEKEKCSCGKVTIECSYWQQVVEIYGELNRKSSIPINFMDFCNQASRQAHIKNFLPTLFCKNRFARVACGNDLIEKAISHVSGKQFILDSSKEPTRALLLSHSRDNFIIHLIRKPVDVVASTYFRIENGDKVKFMRKSFNPKGIYKFIFISVVSFSWSVGNIIIEIIKFIGGKRVVTIKYEDFISDTEGVLNNIGEKLDLNLSKLIAEISNDNEFIIGHNIGGNKFRFNQNFKLDRKRKGRQLPLRYSVWVRLLNWPMMLIYGYNPFK